MNEKLVVPEEGFVSLLESLSGAETEIGTIMTACDLGRCYTPCMCDTFG